VLEQAKSTYTSTFHRLCKEVFTARLEANDNRFETGRDGGTEGRRRGLSVSS